MNSDSQAGHKGAPASRNSKRSAEQRTGEDAGAAFTDWGVNCWRYATITGRTDKSGSTTALFGSFGPGGRNGRLSTGLTTRANL